VTEIWGNTIHSISQLALCCVRDPRTTPQSSTSRSSGVNARNGVYFLWRCARTLVRSVRFAKLQGHQKLYIEDKHSARPSKQHEKCTVFGVFAPFCVPRNVRRRSGQGLWRGHPELTSNGTPVSAMVPASVPAVPPNFNTSRRNTVHNSPFMPSERRKGTCHFESEQLVANHRTCP
jgi:hypothetical protein